MNPMSALEEGFSRAFDWKGRSTRAQFWWFYLFYLVCAVAVVALAIAAESPRIVMPILFILFVPVLGALVRRLHDTGRSGWWYFLAVIPLVGPIILLVLLCERSVPRANAYGPPPEARATRTT
ncbi:uncharacterized membrane protein YhaH (DUF805 family) [Stackebrandtia albiflava]|uniref:Uncharacterized membrane protein YhaH (DUF805 family) n=1 Tax=Stackebrandtia albiflava TaxID=406432 RepID=A0A562URI8_9ACTN|nr:DUF805 domain-containing protein [Stackebrandtia albiflava]TWJ08229.1 uncharacterized membrane protein YhaH (DUF805 family) [Stackebrandtia albiflava]